jgi:hypothetical protein
VHLAEPPLLQRLRKTRSVLVAGAGGGFDVYAGLPLYFHLRNAGKQVHLANLSFTNLAEVRRKRIGPHLVEVSADSEGPAEYFPERALARWFRAHGERIPIFCFDRVGCRPLAQAYRELLGRLQLDAIVLIDGGTDILIRGDEAGLGTPQEDITSLAAVTELDVPEKIVVCVGFGVERGVCHAHLLEGVAALSREGAFLGTLSLLRGAREVDQYLEAVAFSSEQTPASPSIISLSVASAIEGEFGDVHRTTRTQGSKLWINPLMSLYWGFDLASVARRCLYLEAIRDTQTLFEVAARIEAFRDASPTRPWEDVPL